MIDNIIAADTMQAAVLRLLSDGWTSPVIGSEMLRVHP